MGDYPKAVYHGIRDRLPFPGQSVREEAEDRLGELPEVRMQAVVSHVAVHGAPQTPGQIEMRAQGGRM